MAKEADKCEHTSRLLLNNFWCNCPQEIHSHFEGSICQVLCTSIGIISALFPGGPSAKVCLSAKFGVPVFKASILDSLEDPSAKVGLSAKFGEIGEIAILDH